MCCRGCLGRARLSSRRCRPASEASAIIGWGAGIPIGAKAALNQLVRTAAVELARRSPDALCIALHPGTVATALSAPFAATGLEVHLPSTAARHLLAVIDQLPADANGGFFEACALLIPCLGWSSPTCRKRHAFAAGPSRRSRDRPWVQRYQVIRQARAGI